MQTFSLLQLLSFLADNIHHNVTYGANISPKLASFTEGEVQAKRQHISPSAVVI